MADSLRDSRRWPDISYAGGDENNDELSQVSDIRKDLEGWREVLLPLTSLLRWDQPYYPAIIAGTTTFLFSIVWYTEMSALTTVSLACMLIGLFDFVVPFLGPTITGYKTWTATEESMFIEICEQIAQVRQDVIDTWFGLSAMRQQNAKMFFFVVMGVLAVTAWIGNLIDNLFLSYLIVTGILLMPGLRHHQVANKYLQPVFKALNKLKAETVEKPKMN